MNRFYTSDDRIRRAFSWQCNLGAGGKCRGTFFTLYYLTMTQRNSLCCVWCERIKMYTTKKLADMSGVSVRTLHHYDQIGLIRPRKNKNNGYREYGQAEALRLQQVFFFRELGVPLDEIKVILDRPDFDLLAALEVHQKAVKEKIVLMHELQETIDNTIKKLKGKLNMADKDLYKGFASEKQQEYEREIAKKYGKKVVHETKEKTRKWSDQEWSKVQEELTAIHDGIAKYIAKGPGCPEVQAQIARHRAWLNNFYECGPERHLGVAEHYRSHPDFIENYKKFLGHEQGAEFMYQAIKLYCENEGK